jgi:hypothetical protein
VKTKESSRRVDLMRGLFNWHTFTGGYASLHEAT